MDNVSGIFPLTPPQSGMLFHSLQSPDDGTYVVQYTCRVHGTVDAQRLRAAWSDTVRAHPALRAAFLYEGLDEPMQVIRSEVTLPWIEHDWSELDPDSWETRLDEALHHDRELGFDLAQAPLVRVAWVTLSEDLHQLIWTYHHIIADGWSSVLLIDEVWERYLDPEQARAPAPSFGDFVTWPGRRSAPGAGEYWRTRLDGAALPTVTQFERPSPNAPAGHRRRVRSLSLHESERLREFARVNRLTMSTVVHGAWALTQSRCSNTDDVVYGATVSGRPSDMPDVDRIVGAFINTLPVRADTGSGKALVPWLHDLQEQLLALRDRQVDALGDVARWAGVRPSDVFNTILVFENAPRTESPLAGTDIRLSDVRYFDQSNYGFALLVVPSEELELHAVYRPDHIAPRAATRLLDLVIDTLRALPDVGDEPVTALGPPWSSERDHLEGALATGDELESPVDVVERFLAHAASTPDAAAVRSPEGDLTYAEVRTRAAGIAHTLKARGLGPGHRVGILAPKGQGFVAGVLGTLWTGSSYVPIDPAYPRSRVELMLRSSGARHVLTTQELEPLAREVTATQPGAPEVLVIGGATAGSDEGALVPSLEASSEHEAYVIFTSGSTGQPKGVSVSRANLAHSNGARSAVYGASKHTYLMLSPVSFDSSVAGLFWPLSEGGTLAIAAPEVERDPRALGREIRRLRVSMTLCVPSLYRLILEQAETDDLGTLETVIVAGEACDSALVHAHAQRLPDATLVNEYGPTECTVWSTFARLTSASILGGVPIGRPVPGAFVRVVDPHGRTVPIGVAGELYVGGPTVASGYVGLPNETRDRFVEDPIRSSSVVYRTGDRVRMDSDGTLYFLGRTDAQVKVRGYRIEPAEVEAALTAHPEIVEAAVGVRSLGASGSTLVAYVAPSSGRALEATGVREFLSGVLPNFMIPALFVPVPRLPRTPHGKVDFHALPDPERVGGRDPGSERPRSEVEDELHDLWASVLGADELGLDTSFFESGGDSLTGIRLLGRIRDRWGVDFSMQMLFERPTIAEIAENVEAILWARSPEDGEAGLGEDREEVEF